MCTVLLPPGVNPIAVNKYIIIIINFCVKSFKFEKLLFTRGLQFISAPLRPSANRKSSDYPLQLDIHFEISALDSRRVLCYFVLTFLPEDG
jgi:hypothetical protein